MKFTRLFTLLILGLLVISCNQPGQKQASKADSPEGEETDNGWVLLSDGKICLQDHGSKILFRNITIKEL